MSAQPRTLATWPAPAGDTPAQRLALVNDILGRPRRASSLAEQARADHPSVPTRPARRARHKWWPL